MTPPKKNKTCPRCGSNVTSNQCQMCSYEFKNRIVRMAFINSNRKDIMNDVKSVGVNATVRKWRISANTILRLPEYQNYRKQQTERRIKCNKCGSVWNPRVKNPKSCPHCKTFAFRLEPGQGLSYARKNKLKDLVGIPI